jgi:hypothetical protein
MTTKYIKLYEDYQQDIKNSSEETSHTWTQIRDAIQTKIPFVILAFRDKQSYLDILESDLLSNDYIKQTASLSKNGALVDYPSIFMILDDDVKFKDEIPQLFEKYKIKTLILGKKGEEYVDYYYEDGSTSEAGNEVVSSISKDDMENDDHFKMGTTYYKFVDFTS